MRTVQWMGILIGLAMMTGCETAPSDIDEIEQMVRMEEEEWVLPEDQMIADTELQE